MENEDARALGAIGALIVELFARQIALLALLRTPDFDEDSYREALRHAHEQLNGVHAVAALRSQASAQRLEEIEKILRGTIFPR
jgi:hypothetical protein